MDHLAPPSKRARPDTSVLGSHTKNSPPHIHTHSHSNQSSSSVWSPTTLPPPVQSPGHHHQLHHHSASHPLPSVHAAHGNSAHHHSAQHPPHSAPQSLLHQKNHHMHGVTSAAPTTQPQYYRSVDSASAAGSLSHPPPPPPPPPPHHSPSPSVGHSRSNISSPTSSLPPPLGIANSHHSGLSQFPPPIGAPAQNRGPSPLKLESQHQGYPGPSPQHHRNHSGPSQHPDDYRQAMHSDQLPHMMYQPSQPQQFTPRQDSFHPMPPSPAQPAHPPPPPEISSYIGQPSVPPTPGANGSHFPDEAGQGPPQPPILSQPPPPQLSPSSHPQNQHMPPPTQSSMSVPCQPGIGMVSQMQPSMAPYDDRRPMLFKGSGQQSPSLGPYRPVPPQQQFQPQTPMMHGVSQYDGFPEGIPLAPGPGGKKKANRASQACDSCRSLKAKCDETKPCRSCRDKGLECKYRDPMPKAADKVQTDILEGIQNLTKMVVELEKKSTQHDEDMRAIKKVILEKDPTFFKQEDEDMQVSVGTNHVYDPTPSAYANNNTNYETPQPQQQSQQQQFRPISIDDPNETDTLMVEPALGEQLEEKPGPVIRPGESAIPPDHTTGAGHLLDWPAVRALVGPILPKLGIDHASEYPVRLEEGRGILRVYGRGEGMDVGVKANVGIDYGSFEADLDMGMEMHSPSDDNIWGFAAGHASPGASFDGGTKTSFDGSHMKARAPGATILGKIDFEPETVMDLGASFMMNIINMHPILTLKQIRETIQHFMDNLPKVPHGASISTAQPPPPDIPDEKLGKSCALGGPAPKSHEPVENGKKRKWSAEDDDEEKKRKNAENSFRLYIKPPVGQRYGRPARTITNGLVLAMLALGKICKKRDAIPVPAQVERPAAKDVPGHSPLQSQSDRNSGSSVPYSPTTGRRRSAATPTIGRGQGTGLHGSYPARNVDVIPGLDYFGMALDIVGSQLGGNSLKHVYANILIGLYFGQLGRVIESHAYISAGSTILLNLLRPSLARMRNLSGRRLPTNNRDNQLMFAFWTCLQLESDIVAELPRQQSGILAYDGTLPYPNITLPTPSDLGPYTNRVLESYMAQLYLRRHLNQIHQMFYGPDCKPGEEFQVDYYRAKTAESQITGMYWVGPSFRFDEDDIPARDILAARMRAKYWGAQMLTYRPFIKQILEFGYQRDHGGHFRPGSDIRVGIGAPMIDQNAEEVPEEVLNYARRSVRALMESTQAFHNLGPDRPIITNVFGTAHAQWGNLVVLSACFKNFILKRFIEPLNLQILFEKTIRFLEQSAGPYSSSALSTDCEILRYLRDKLFDNLQPLSEEILVRACNINLATTSAARYQRYYWLPETPMVEMYLGWAEEADRMDDVEKTAFLERKLAQEGENFEFAFLGPLEYRKAVRELDNQGGDYSSVMQFEGRRHV